MSSRLFRRAMGGIIRVDLGEESGAGYGALASGPVQFIADAGVATHSPLVDPAGSGFFHPLDQRVPPDGGGVARADSGQPGHQLPGAAGADAEELLGNSMSGHARRWSSQLRQKHLMHVLHRPVEPADLIIHMIWALIHPKMPRLSSAPPPQPNEAALWLHRSTDLQG